MSLPQSKLEELEARIVTLEAVIDAYGFKRSSFYRQHVLAIALDETDTRCQNKLTIAQWAKATLRSLL